MKVIIGSDHAGFSVKEAVKAALVEKGIFVEDVGPESTDSVDYPDYALAVGEKVVQGESEGEKVVGILACGCGMGMMIAANKVKGVRAALAYDLYSAEMSRKHNDSNVLCLRSREFPLEKNIEIVNKWLETPFSTEERHQRRVKKITDYEKSN